MISLDDWPLAANALIFVLAAAVVWVCGVKLTHVVDRISARTGLGQAFAGMFFLGVITSLPEVANTLSASATGNPALAVNNLLGSAAINVFLLVLGDAVLRGDALSARTDSPSVLMMGVLCILLMVIVAMAITVGDWGIGGLGALPIAITLFSVWAFWLSSGYADRSAWRVSGVAPPCDGTNADLAGSFGSDLVWLVIAGLVIFVAGVALSITGDALAVQTGMGSGLVGFLLIGVATSAPELSTVIEAIRLKRYEMAFGQVLGTNFVNLSLILLADLVYAGGPVINVLGRFEVVSSLLGAMMIGVFMLGMLERRTRTVFNLGYDSLAAGALFFGGIVVLFHL